MSHFIIFISSISKNSHFVRKKPMHRRLTNTHKKAEQKWKAITTVLANACKMKPQTMPVIKLYDPL